VALHAWRNAGTLLELGKDWALNWHHLKQTADAALSSTPTFLDLLLQHEPETAKEWAPRQITLGGEVLRPRLGARLRRRFPQSRFTVIYATTELGVLFKTNRLDGQYETDVLGQRGQEWRVQEGLFQVRRNGNWLTTGDRVELEGNLLRVIGRADAVANVAGTKVSLAEVTSLAEQVPGVRRAVAVAEPSSVTGQVVGLRFAIEPGFDTERVANDLAGFLRRRLSKPAWPRHWSVEEVEPTVNGKRRVQ
jgi:acyl-CoA synthetase (AMP-forming)/AMP-acid ligase II